MACCLKQIKLTARIADEGLSLAPSCGCRSLALAVVTRYLLFVSLAHPCGCHSLPPPLWLPLAPPFGNHSLPQCGCRSLFSMVVIRFFCGVHSFLLVVFIRFSLWLSLACPVVVSRIFLWMTIVSSCSCRSLLLMLSFAPCCCCHSLVLVIVTCYFSVVATRSCFGPAAPGSPREVPDSSRQARAGQSSARQVWAAQTISYPEGRADLYKESTKTEHLNRPAGKRLLPRGTHLYTHFRSV